MYAVYTVYARVYVKRIKQYIIVMRCKRCIIYSVACQTLAVNSVALVDVPAK